MNIAIIGLGLIGGSMAKTIKKKTSHQVHGYDLSYDVLYQAVLEGTIDKVVTHDYSDKDLILLALYPTASVAFLKQNLENINPNAMIVDLCGVKRVVCRQVETLLKESDITFIGGHPMAGREYSGLAHSTSTLFKHASMILTPSEQVSQKALDEVRSFFLQLGFGKVVITTDDHHDEMIAYTSQLAHIVSSAYIQSPLSAQYMGFSAGSFKDLTRVAKLNDEMWSELFLHNADYLTEQIDIVIENLKQFRTYIADSDRTSLRKKLKTGNDIKESLLAQDKNLV